MNNEPTALRKSNALIEASYDLTIPEHRVFVMCLTGVDYETAVMPSTVFEVTAARYIELFGVSRQTAYEGLEKAVKTMLQRVLTVYVDPEGNPLPPREKHSFPWMFDARYVPDKGKILLRFHQFICPYLGDLRDRFTLYDINEISDFSSAYAIRLYELFVQWKRRGNREVSVSWLRQVFQLNDHYASVSELKRRVVDPAIKHINESKSSALKVSYVQKKTGREVTHLVFTFNERKPAKPPKAKPVPAEPAIAPMDYEKPAPKPSEVAEHPPGYLEFLKSRGRTPRQQD